MRPRAIDSSCASRDTVVANPDSGKPPTGTPRTSPTRPRNDSDRSPRCGAPTDGSPKRQLWVQVQEDASPGRGDRIPVTLASLDPPFVPLVRFVVQTSATAQPRRPPTTRNSPIVLELVPLLVLAPVCASPLPAWTLLKSTHSPPVSPPSAPTLLPPSSSPEPGRTSGCILKLETPPPHLPIAPRMRSRISGDLAVVIPWTIRAKLSARTSSGWRI